MKILIVSGMSGAGKSTVIRIIEDLGYYCIDSLPPSLIPKFIEVCSHSEGRIKKVAMVIDSRLGYLFDDLINQIKYLDDNNFEYKMLFLDANDEELVKRYKENRRVHPLARGIRITEGISQEREILRNVKSKSNYILDTSDFNQKKLKEHILALLETDGEKVEGMLVNVFSFGFKYRTPIDADLVFDVRFISNPFYIESLRGHTGNDKDVRDYVLIQEETTVFLDKLKDMLDFLIPNYIKEGKSQLVIGIGCTGGQHRSVTIVNEIYEYLKENGHNVISDHRDIEKSKKCIV